MLQEISYYPIFGKPLLMYIGLAVLLSFSYTAYLGYSIFKGKKIPFKRHQMAAVTSFAIAIVHAILGILLYF
jgi:hypothetical protein